MTSSSAKETKELGRRLAKQILKKPSQTGAAVLALTGCLGSGKTSFLQGFSQGLKVKQPITSPTFVIVKKYQLSNIAPQRETNNYRQFYHIDCYRINTPEEILKLSFQEIINSPKNIVAVEWAEKIKGILPKNTLWLRFVFQDKNKREIRMA